MSTKQGVWLDLERFRELRDELSDIDKVIRRHIKVPETVTNAPEAIAVLTSLAANAASVANALAICLAHDVDLATLEARLRKESSHA